MGVGLPDRYRYEGELGAGGMGQVWQVYDQVLQRSVALKFVRGELAASSVALGRFRKEAQATAQLEHPGVVPVYDAGAMDDGRLFYTMKQVQGRTLGRALLDAASLSERLALLPAVCDACDAVAYAHARGVLHRDLKPDNILLGAFGQVHVLDWGLVKVVGTDPDAVPAVSVTGPAATRYGAVSGTPGFMAPEQRLGLTDALGTATDVYALGAIVYVVLTGRGPGTRRICRTCQARPSWWRCAVGRWPIGPWTGLRTRQRWGSSSRRGSRETAPTGTGSGCGRLWRTQRTRTGGSGSCCCACSTDRVSRAPWRPRSSGRPGWTPWWGPWGTR